MEAERLKTSGDSGAIQLIALKGHKIKGTRGRAREDRRRGASSLLVLRNNRG